MRVALGTQGWSYADWAGDMYDAAARPGVRDRREDDVAWWARAFEAASARVARVFGYVNNNYEGHAPATARALYAALGLAHERPHRIEQTRLF